ncbi:UPF0761 membrane protein [Trichinella spiralis]|uniref:UPF0761 membrane protein n=1 Tax=Trichinella spiralis TaxID=6334 RepID=A0ABR3KLS5_TRISP
MSDQSGWTIQLADTSLDQLDRSRSDIESFGRVGFKARLHLADVETNIFWLVNFKSSLLQQRPTNQLCEKSISQLVQVRKVI